MSDGAPEVLAKVGALVRRDSGGRFTLTLPAGWIAVPRESAAHLSRTDAQRFSAAFQSLGASEVWAVALELVDELEAARQYPSSETGLTDLNRAWAHFNCAITTAGVGALVLCTTDDYLVVCGPVSFVESALGASVESARAAFRDYAADPFWPPAMKRSLHSVARALSSDERDFAFPS